MGGGASVGTCGAGVEMGLKEGSIGGSCLATIRLEIGGIASSDLPHKIANIYEHSE